MGDSTGNLPHDLSQRSTVPVTQPLNLQAPTAHSRTPATFGEQLRVRPVVRAVPQTSPRTGGSVQPQGHVLRAVATLPLAPNGQRARNQTPSVVGGQWVLSSPSPVLTFSPHSSTGLFPASQPTSQAESSKQPQPRPLVTTIPVSRLGSAGTTIRLPAGVAVGSRVTIPPSRPGTSVTITTTNASAPSSRQSPLPEARIGLIRAVPAHIRPSLVAMRSSPTATSQTLVPLSLASPVQAASTPSMITIKAVGNSSSLVTSAKPVLSAVGVIPGSLVSQISTTPASVTAPFIRTGSLISPAPYTSSQLGPIRAKPISTGPMLASALTFDKPRFSKSDPTSQAIDLSTGGGAQLPSVLPGCVVNAPISAAANEGGSKPEAGVSVQPMNPSHAVSLTMTIDSPMTPNKVGASPRPTILRKRDVDVAATPLKAQRNLTSVFGTGLVLTGIHPLNATPPGPEQNFTEESIEVFVSSIDADAVSDLDVSPRKKRRKQLLQVQDIESEHSDDATGQEESAVSGEMEVETSDDVSPYVKLPRMSLLETYKPSWKPCQNHFQRYSDVKVKDEKRPTVTDLANQKQILQTVRGWNVYHVESQLSDISDMEAQAGERFRMILQSMENQTRNKDTDRVIELLKGNLQRCKVIHDQIVESKNQIGKIFDHKPTIEEVIKRYNVDSNSKQEKDKVKKK